MPGQCAPGERDNVRWVSARCPHGTCPRTLCAVTNCAVTNCAVTNCAVRWDTASVTLRVRQTASQRARAPGRPAAAYIRAGAGCRRALGRKLWRPVPLETVGVGVGVGVAAEVCVHVRCVLAVSIPGTCVSCSDAVFEVLVGCLCDCMCGSCRAFYQVPLS